MPVGIFIMLLIILVVLGLLYGPFHIGKCNVKSQENFFMLYWGVLILLEIIYILFLVEGVQFLPPSFYINYVYGTVFFVLYCIQCFTSDNLLSRKLKFIGVSAVLNYIMAPLILSFLKY